MQLPDFPFRIIDWEEIVPEKHPGTSGYATWKLYHMGNIRIRMVEYSPGYRADHWCNKGHIIYCIAGEMDTSLADGRICKLKKGNSYLVGDQNEAHSSQTAMGCVLFIVD